MASNEPKKRLKQTSIRDFISVGNRSDHNLSVSQMTPNYNSSETNDKLEDTLMVNLNEVPESPDLHNCDLEEVDSDQDIETLSELNRMSDPMPVLPPLRNDPSLHRFILFFVPLTETMDSIPNPYPTTFSDKWDAKHVKMPNSFRNQIISVQSIGDQMVKRSVPKWDVIQETLLSDIKSVEQLEEAIKIYTPFAQKYKFDVLYELFHKKCSEEERTNFFNEIMPKMIELALNLPQIVTQSVPLLTQRQNATLFLSQQQIACLLSNAFFCTFPKRSRNNEEYKNYQNFNFLSLFSSLGSNYSLTIKAEKLKCIINYFRRVIKDMPKGVISFERRYLTQREIPDWSNSNKKLRKLIALSDGVIEKEGKDLLQVDFANEYIGGGVLGSGCVQEEIRFVICPELLVSLLFTERLLDTESLLICGSEQFSSYSGYANTFEWENDFTDHTGSDQWGRRLTQIVAIDALEFNRDNSYMQFETKRFERELNKAFSGFVVKEFNSKTPIASGNWGCGAFNGDPLLKAIIQLMAASEAERDIVFFTFNDFQLKKKLKNFYKFLIENDFRVNHLQRGVVLYHNHYRNTNSDIFQFILDSKQLILN